MIKTILFDLDATLARMDQDTFINTYLQKLGAYVAARGYDPQAIIQGIWTGTGAMLKNDGSMTNEKRFWQVFGAQVGTEVSEALNPVLTQFYNEEFDSIKSITEANKTSRKMIAELRRKGYKLGLATSPVFPRIATHWRIGWAGLAPEDFDFITTYENCHYGKPSPEYYQEVLTALGAKPEECLMVGNDADEDMCVTQMGMSAYLVTEHLLNRHDKDISAYPQGTLADLAAYLETLPDLRYAYHRTAQYYETDQMGVVHHSNYIRWFEEARVAWMDELGFGYDVMESLGVSSPVVGVQCSYKLPVRFHDRVVIRLKIETMTPTRLTVAYEVADEATGEVRATGESNHCFLDIAAGRPIALNRKAPEVYTLFKNQ